MQAAEFIHECKSIVGARFVITSTKSMERFCRGFRSGKGKALAVVRPGSLLEQWQMLELCHKNNKIIIMQAANTGLTEGSSPSSGYDRDVVIISTTRMRGLKVIKDGKQVIAFPGTSLVELEKELKSFQRQPHSVIGSSCMGASVIGGICNNSGGALVQRGPAYTELSLFAKINSNDELVLINHLGIELGQTPEEILSNLENGNFNSSDIETNNRLASDKDYEQRVRDIKSNTPARFNADPKRLHEAAGCAGKLSVFAVRLDTFPIEAEKAVFYIGASNPEKLASLRRHMLSTFDNLPVSAEYIHRDCYDVSKKYGKDTILAIKLLGTARLSLFWDLKIWIDTRLNGLFFIPKNLTDKFLLLLGKMWPNILPKRMERFRNRFEHHLILTMAEGGIKEAWHYLRKNFNDETGDYFVCEEKEAELAVQHRFAAAGAAVKYMAIHHKEVVDIISLDIALRRNDTNWFETLPSDIDNSISHKLYYGHFFCHVLHQDYIIKKGHDSSLVKNKLLMFTAKRGAKYPAEHNVGHMYEAEKSLVDFYKNCDPTNSFNPGIGGMEKNKNYKNKFCC